jgi:two-component system nitrogen regulation response regulator NtrX
MMNENILIIDDESNILKSVKMILGSEGFKVFTAQNLKQAREILAEEEIYLYLLDVFLPDGDGIEFISHIRDKQPDAVVIMISGHASIKMAINATQQGADDFIEKPLSKDKLLLTLKNFRKRLELQEQYRELQKRLVQDPLIGQSQAIKDVKEQIKKIAPTNGKVLITGESGTGKEIVAALIHQQSSRNTGALIKINCAAIPEELIESELFGVEKGAFTGASERRDGKFKQADRGTLLLDEIGDMSLKTQIKVLRVLQEGEFERVGGSETVKTDVRILAATNKDLEALVRSEKFREDLYFRLNVLTIEIPALRDRIEDIPLLIDYFIQLFSTENNKRNIRISEETLLLLKAYPWPGNIRELRNLVERLVIMCDGELIDVDDLPGSFFHSVLDINDAFINKHSLRQVRDQIEARYISLCLDRYNGNVSKTAKLLNVDRTYLYKKIQKLGLKRESK